MIDPYVIDQSHLTLMSVLKGEGFPCRWSFCKGDWEPDMMRIRKWAAWQERDVYIYEWEIV